MKSFWVVTRPTGQSELADVCFKSTPREIGLQFLGGLKPNDVVGFYESERTAKELARIILAHPETISCYIRE
jgi:hypothetical protein